MIKNAFLRTILILLVVNIAVFLLAGKVFFDKRPAIDEKTIERFFSAMQNEKIGTYYLNIDKFSKNHGSMEISVVNSTGGAIIKKQCYKIYPDRFAPAAECEKDLAFVFDEHSMGSLLTSSFYSKGIIFSEILSGHFKIYGIKVEDALAVL